MANFRPLYDRVLVKRVEADTMTSSGLFLPCNIARPREGKNLHSFMYRNL